VVYLRPFERSRLLDAAAELDVYLAEHPGADGVAGEAATLNLDLTIVVLDPSDAAQAEVLSRLRERTSVLVAVIPNSEADAVAGALEAGADVWVADTMDQRPLEAQLRAALRTAVAEREAGRGPVDALQFDELQLDLGRYSVTTGEARQPLTPTEFAIMRRLFETPDRVVANRDLVAQVSNLGRRAATTANLKTTIRKLRLKLDSLGGYGNYIKTVRGVGYSLSR
jgi:DNA-binding response OmpR family regulator